MAVGAVTVRAVAVHTIGAVTVGAVAIHTVGAVTIGAVTVHTVGVADRARTGYCVADDLVVRKAFGHDLSFVIGAAGCDEGFCCQLSARPAPRPARSGV